MIEQRSSPTPTTSSRCCPTATTRSWAITCAPVPTGSASAWRSPGRSSRIRSPTAARRGDRLGSTTSRNGWSRRRWTGSRSVGRRSSWPIDCRRSGRPTGSRCSTTAGWSRLGTQDELLAPAGCTHGCIGRSSRGPRIASRCRSRSKVAFDLERFVVAQGVCTTARCARARAGRKTGHWIWFIFLSSAGSAGANVSVLWDRVARRARAYLEHPVLGPRLRVVRRRSAGDVGRDRRADLWLARRDEGPLVDQRCSTVLGRAGAGEALDRFYGASRTSKRTPCSEPASAPR